MSEALYNKYRPWKLSELFQTHIVQSLSNSIIKNDIHPSFIFVGGKGAGKTTFVRAFAMALNCENKPEGQADPCGECESCQMMRQKNPMHPSYHEINAANETGVDGVRKIEEYYNIAPRLGKYRIIALDEAHMLTSAAQNCLLKPLEEPPASVKFILCTTKLAGIIDTIQSRAFIYNFKRVSLDKLSQLLTQICDAEEWPYEAEAITQVAMAAEGSPRNAVKMLSQLNTLGVTVDNASDIVGTSSLQLGLDILQNIIGSEPVKLVQIVDAIFSENKDHSMVLKALGDLIYNMIVIMARGTVDYSPEVMNRIRGIMDIIKEREQIRTLLDMPGEIVAISKEFGFHNISPRMILLSGLLRLENRFGGGE